MAKQSKPPNDPRRAMVLGIAVVLIFLSVWISYRMEPTGTTKAISMAAGRIGLVMGALWLAWPSLRRPASWLPPGFAMFGVIVLGVVATQPKTFLILLPAFAGLLTLASILKAFRN